MSASLSPSLPASFARAAERMVFFSTDERRTIEVLEKREQPQFSKAHDSCKTNLFFGFFFDGTRNNYLEAVPAKEYSNVARLYDAYPGNSVPGVLTENEEWKNNKGQFSNFFRVYIPGVGSRFKHVNDKGEGIAKLLGGSSGKKGNDRIIWALLQAINSVHRYFYGSPLLSPEETTDFATRLSLSKEARNLMTVKTTAPFLNRATVELVLPRDAFERILGRLHTKVAPHWMRQGQLPEKLKPGIVQKIYISTFGFSRGATQARAFANWLDSLCRLDAMLLGKAGRTLGGFPVEFDFLGLFDTVASVGAGNTFGNAKLLKLFDGHGAWADAEDSLRVCSSVGECLHLVAGHELRRSFPLDSIAVGTTYPAKSQEIVFPGVHSDVGGGYAPKQQGKGIDENGDDMLSRLPLLFMYKAARLAGVPFKLELADDIVKRKFAVKPEVIRDFNNYLSQCSRRSGSLTDIVREQQILQIQWRYWRRDHGPAPIQTSPNFMRASNYDKNDLESANKEFNAELAAFEKSLAKWKNSAPKKQDAGFDNSVPNEWEEIATYWPLRQPNQQVSSFIDQYVHDSRAAFKLRGPDSENETLETFQKWSEELRTRRLLYNKPIATPYGPYIPGPPDYGMATNARMLVEEFERARKSSPNERDLKKFIPRYINEGREPASLADAGYFRFRKIYGGSDAVLLSNLRSDYTREGSAYASIDDYKDGSRTSERDT
jgi:hypothetical protein